MKVKDVILQLQEALLIPQEKRVPKIGPLSRAAFNRLATMDPESEWNTGTVTNIHVGTRQLNSAGEELIKHFEALYLHAYKDEVGVWTIGWGHTGLQHNDGTVYEGRVITAEKAEELFLYDMHQFEARVSSIIKVPLNDDQYSALVSFDFNTGGLTLSGGGPSGLTKKLNDGDYEGAADEFLRWNRAGGRVLNGLTRRRKSERNLFRSIHPAIVPA